MPLLYPFKRVTRNWNLFVALLIGIILASTFFAAINIKANLAAKDSLDKQLNQVTSDLEFSTTINSTNLAWALNNISSIEGVKSVAVVSRLYQTAKLPSDNFTASRFIPIVVFPDSEMINNEWLNRPETEFGENQTYIVVGNNFKDQVEVGDNISTSISFPMPKYYNSTYIPVNLTVAGIADLTDKGYAFVSGNRFFVSSLGPSGSIERYNFQQDIMIVGWNSTFVKLWSNITNSAISATFLINVDHDKLLNPWDVAASAKNVQTVADDIQNNVLAYFETYGNIDNILGNILTNFEYSFSTTLLNYVLVSLPVFFVAWYLGSTVSDVSYNLRRREIGLLSTKGMSSGQIQRMFLTEALTIGFIGGAIGVVCALALNQVFIGELDLNNLFNPSLFSPTTMLVTIIFGMVLALFSAFRSARKASRLPTVQALREYTEPDSGASYRKKLPWVAFILGAYKMSMFALGINLSTFLTQQGFTSVGGINYILTLVLVYFDLVLTYIGPILFFWGGTKIFIENSLKFQQLTANVSRLTGDLGALAAKNVRRNPKRLAAIAFLIAFIVGYSVQVTGQIASEQDLVIRTVHYQVGADISLSITNASQAPVIISDILRNVSGIKNYTLECQLTQNSQNYGQAYVKTIDPDSWQASAYFEPEWFTGASMEQAMNSLKTDNMTIILEKREADRLNVKVGDQVGINFPSGPRKLTVVGFYGPEPVKLDSSSSQTYAIQTWSYVPRNLFNMTIGSDAYPLEHFDTAMLIELQAGVNGSQIAEQIRSLDLDIYGVESFDEQWAISQQNNNSYTYNSLQTLDVQRLGLIFAVLSASVGTALVSLVSLKERSREATLMSVRGLSYRQLVWMFLTENIAAITFSVVLGLAVGTVILYGTVSTSSSIVSALVTRHMVFPSEAVTQVGFYIALIYGSVIISVLIMARRYVTKLDKMVRLR
jgi:ABC-type antimicrobial peptide transport system permease subunit